MANTPKNKSRLKGWLGLLVGALAIVAFHLVVLSTAEMIPEVQQMTEFIERSGIEPTALYYTEVDACYEAEINARHTVFYPPVGPNGSPKWDSGTP